MANTPVHRSGALSTTREAGGEVATTGARLRALETVATDILSNLDLEATLLSVINAAVDLTGADMAGIMLGEEDGTLRMGACRGHRVVGSVRTAVRPGEGVAGQVFETGLPRRVDDIPDEPSISMHIRGLAQEEKVRSALGAPMIVRGRAIGTVMAWSRQPGTFTESDEEVLVGLANLATIAIENARLYETERAAVRTLEDARGRLEEQFALLRRATEVHEELTNLVLSGGGISHLVETVAKHTGGRVAILDADLTVLVKTPGADDDVLRADRHLKEVRRYTTSGVIGVLEPAGKWRSWLIIRPVVAGGDRLGYLCVGLDHDPGSLDPVIVEQAAVVCALELTKERAVLEARTRVRSDFIWDLLEGNIADDAEAVVRARHLGYALPPLLRVMFISADGLAGWAREAGADAETIDRRREALARTVEQLVRQYGLPQPLAAFRGSIIALLFPCGPDQPGIRDATSPSDDTARARRLAVHLLRELGAANPDLRFAAGVSACSPLAGNLRPARIQAESALASVSILAAATPVALFDDLGVLRFLIAPGDRDDLSSFARSVLGPVIDYDVKHSADLVDTVEAFLAEDCSLQRTAERLHMHRKTVRYRLDRIEQLTQRDLSSQKHRFETQLAVTIIRALSLELDVHQPR